MLTDLAQANFWWTALRKFWSMFDKLIYSIMSFVYQVFLNVASQNILGGGVVKALVGRMQLIVGIVFLFIFAIHIVQGIINPDLFTDKDNGTSKLVIKVIIALCLIAAMIPLNIPSSNSASNSIIAESNDYKWEDALSEQGLLFGTLTFFQNKVLETNVLGKLVLGDNTADYDSLKGVEGDEEKKGLSAAGDYMSTEILRKFITPNQQPDYIVKDSEEGIQPGDSITDDDDRGYVCSGTPEFSNADDGRLGLYQEENDINKLFGYIDNVCTLDEGKAGENLGDEGLAGEYYMFSYMGGYSTLVGIFVLFVLISFTVEVAVRVFKLLVLRIMGPIAAVGYIIPNKSGNMFSTWTKEVAATYADIFIRLAVIYFSILVVSGLLGGGLTGSIYDATTGVGFVTVIFLIVGLFLFAKQAPKYIKSLFGITDENGKGLFSGIGALAGMALGAAGVVGGMVSGAAGGMKAAVEGGAGALRTGLSGLTGGIGGMFRAGRAAIGAESNGSRGRAAMDAVQQRNAMRLAQARANVSNRDRLANRWRSLIGGEPVSQSIQARIDDLQTDVNKKSQLRDTLASIKSRAADEVGKHYKTSGDLGLSAMQYDRNYVKNKGAHIGAVNYKHFKAQYDAAVAKGDKFVDFNDVKGVRHSISLEAAGDKINYLKTTNENDYIANHNALGIKDNVIDGNIANARSQGYTGEISRGEIGGAIDRLDKSINESNVEINQKQTEFKRQSTVDSFNKK